jgi:hypothetical protein
LTGYVGEDGCAAEAAPKFLRMTIAKTENNNDDGPCDGPPDTFLRLTLICRRRRLRHLWR